MTAAHAASWYGFLGALLLRAAVPSARFDPSADALADFALLAFGTAAWACARLRGDAALAPGARAPALLLAAAVVQAAAAGTDPEGRVRGVSDALAWGAAFLCAGAHRRRAGELALILCLSGGFAGLHAFHQKTGALDLFLAEGRLDWMERETTFLPTRPDDIIDDRARALLATRDPFGPLQPYNPNALGGFLLLVLPVHLAVIRSLARSRAPAGAIALHGLLASLEAYGLVACRSLGAWGALALAGVFAALARAGRTLPGPRARALAAGLLAATAATPFLPAAWDVPLHFRPGYAAGAARAILAHPGRGWGLGTFPDASSASQPAWATHAKHAHQEYLEMAVEGGILLPLAFLLLAGTALATRGASPTAPRDDAPPACGERPSAGVLLACLGGLGVAAILGTVPHTRDIPVETLFAAAAVTTLAGAAALSIRGRLPDLASIEGAARFAVTAILIFALSDYPLRVPGISCSLAALLGLLAGAPPETRGLSHAAVLPGERPVPVRGGAALVALCAVGGWGALRVVPEATVPQVLPDDPGAQREDLDSQLARTPWRTSVILAWGQRLAAEARAGSPAGRREAWYLLDEATRRRPWSAALWETRVALLADEPERAVEYLEAAERLVAACPRTPGTHATRADALERVANDVHLGVVSAAWRIPPVPLKEEMLREAAQEARAAIAIDPDVPWGEQHRRLTGRQTARMRALAASFPEE